MPDKAKATGLSFENQAQDEDMAFNPQAVPDFPEEAEYDAIQSSVTAGVAARYSRFAIRMVISFIVVATLVTLLLSDTMLSFFPLSAQAVQWLQWTKIWLIIIITAALLYRLISQQTKVLIQQQHDLIQDLQALQRLTKIQQLTIQTHHAILRIHDKEQLLKEICQILKQYGEFAYVWIGISEDPERLPNVIVTSDKNDEYLRFLLAGLKTSSATEKGEPAISALRKKYAVVVNDVPGFSKNPFAWQMRALEYSYLSVAGFPFKTAAGLSGVLALYASEKNYFSEPEIIQLRSLAADISYGLSDIENKTQLYYAANYDVVTHLPNQQLFADRLKQAMARALHDKRFVGVLVIEIEHFLKTTESLGPAVADKILIETGIHLERLVRDGDTVARISHNQIGVMLADVAEELDVATVAQKLIKPFVISLAKSKELTVRLLAGVAIYPQDGESEPILLKNASQALAESHYNSRTDCFFFSKKLSSGLKYSQQMKSALPQALVNNEMTLYYQPIVSVADRKIVGIEALSRWRNPQLGDVSPVQFIAEAEASGFILTLGEWSIKTACQQLMTWRQRGQDNFVMTVNLSTLQLMDAQFLVQIKKVFQEISFDPKQYSLGFEISENALVNELKHTIDILQTLREMGLQIIIDDFGTGYASLSYLHQLPVDILKIDSMFIRNLGRNQSSQAMVRGILAFAQGLNVKTIAEGVETDTQMSLLKDLGCDYVQGYLCSAPLPAKNMEALFGKNL